VPLSEERGSVSVKGGTSEGKRMSGVEKSMDGAGIKNSEIEAGFASLLAGDLLRMRGSDVGKGVGVGVLDKISPLTLL
jgi:hypothetical protein